MDRTADQLRPSSRSSLHEEAVSPVEEQQAFLPVAARESSSVSESQHDNQKGHETGEAKKIPSSTLHRSTYVILLVLLYAALAIFAWVITCILTVHPLTTTTYTANIVNAKNHGYGWTGADYQHSLYMKNERYFRTARVLQSIVTVLTIPLTSAVCSKAAVVFVQHHRKSLGLTLRQAMVLADKGWTEPEIWLKLVFAGWKRYGSSFLVFAIFLNLLGGTISPLQQIFLSQHTIKTPTFPQILDPYLFDIYDHFPSGEYASGIDFNLVTVLTRNAMASTTNLDVQSRLWQGNATGCNALNSTSNPTPEYCMQGGLTFGNWSELGDPFLAQLPNGYSTGLIRQFAPRVNSTAYWEEVAEVDYPKDCGHLPGAFFVQYANQSADYYSGNWSVEACMPVNQTQSPWRSTRTRQDFTEELYLNISVTGSGSVPTTIAGPSLTKITLNTTAGFFELPNYMNGQVAGPLILDDPSNYCGLDCYESGYTNAAIFDHNLTKSDVKRTVADSITYNQTNSTDVIFELETLQNKGPLLTIALALFGHGSFIAERVAQPDTFIHPMDREHVSTCTDMVPFLPLLRDNIGQKQVGNPIDYCYRDGQVDSMEELQYQIAYYLQSFYYNQWDGYAGERIKNAFTSAAFLANEAWMLNPAGTGDGSLWVTYDLGADSQIPVISKTGMIVISTLLGLDLLLLLALAIYSSWTPRWTGQLDSFAMMRIGAALNDQISLGVSNDKSKVKVLDETPGWIGDATGGEGQFGELGIGAPVPLKCNRRYRCYGGDYDPGDAISQAPNNVVR